MKAGDVRRAGQAVWLPLVLAAAGASAQTALKVETAPGARAVKATIVNTSGAACGAELAFGDGREEKLRLEGRESRQVDHTYAADGSYAVRLKGELYVRGLRTAAPCGFDEAVQVRVAPPAPPPVASQGVPGLLPSLLPALQGLPGLAGLPIPVPGVAAPAPSPGVTLPVPAAAPAPASAPAPAPAPAPAVPVAIAPQATPGPRVPGAGDDVLVWRRVGSPVLEFVTTAAGQQRLVSGEALRWAGFDACWLGLPDQGLAYGGDQVQEVSLDLVRARLSAQVGGRPVAGRFVDCAVGGGLQGHADVLLVQREALTLVRQKLPGFSAFEPMGELSHSELGREAAAAREAQQRRARALAPLLAAEQARADLQRRQGLARQYPYTAVLRCAGPAGTVDTATCLAGRTLRAQLELANGEVKRQLAAGDLAQAGTETPQGLVILLRDRFTIETQNVDERLTLTLRIVETASDQLVFERAAGRFEVLRASR